MVVPVSKTLGRTLWSQLFTQQVVNTRVQPVVNTVPVGVVLWEDGQGGYE